MTWRCRSVTWWRVKVTWRRAPLCASSIFNGWVVKKNLKKDNGQEVTYPHNFIFQCWGWRLNDRKDKLKSPTLNYESFSSPPSAHGRWCPGTVRRDVAVNICLLSQTARGDADSSHGSETTLICSISAETGRSPERRRTWDVSLFFHVTDHRGLNTADKESGEVHELCDVKPLWSFAPFSFRRNLRLGFHSLQLSSIRTVRLRNRDWAPIYLLRWNEYLMWLNMINPYASYPLSDTANVPFSFHWTPL